MGKTRILVVSDTHCASVYGLWHPEYVTTDGRKIGLNPLQKELFKDWQTMVSEVYQPTHLCDFAVINGDAVDGVQPKSYGKECMTTNMEDQKFCFEKLFKMIPLKHPKTIYASSGSGYHEAQTGEIHRQIVEGLTGDYSHFYLAEGDFVNVDGWRIYFGHGSSSAFIYIEQLLGREVTFMLSSAAVNKIGYADAVVFAHLHKYSEIKQPGMRLHHFKGLLAPAVMTVKAVIGPGFQAQSGYMKRKSPFKLIPDIGYMILEVDDEGVHVKERLFRPIVVAKRGRTVSL